MHVEVFCTGLYPKAKGNDIVIPDGITSVENIFYDRSDITSVFIGGNVKQIINPAINSSFYEGAPPILYDGAFTAFDITNIKNISVSENNKTFFFIDKMLCENSDDGEVELLICLPTASGKITVPDGVTYLSRSSFKGCENLTGVTMPNSVRTIGVDAFRGLFKTKKH